MSLEERLVEEMKQAMKSNDKLRLSTIRMIRSALKNKEIELRKKLEAHAKELREVVAAIDASLAQLRQAPKTAKRAAKKR